MHPGEAVLFTGAVIVIAVAVLAIVGWIIRDEIRYYKQDKAERKAGLL